MNSINLHGVLKTIECAISIKYHDGRLINFERIKKIREKIELLEQKLLYSNYNNMKPHFSNLSHKNNDNSGQRIVRQLNQSRKIITNFRKKIKNDINDICTIVYRSNSSDISLKLKSGKVHSNTGPAVVFDFGNEINELYYINGNQMIKKEWVVHNRKYKIDKIHSSIKNNHSSS